MDLSLDPESDMLASSVDMSLSIAQSNSSASSICPPSCNNINLPHTLLWKASQLHPSAIPNSHISPEEFKEVVNAALKNLSDGQTYNEVKVFGLTWKDNNLGLKTPEKGSIIEDETEELMRVFRDQFGYCTQYYRIPSLLPFENVQYELVTIRRDLANMKAEGKKVLLIVYYNGHGGRKDNKQLIWSA